MAQPTDMPNASKSLVVLSMLFFSLFLCFEVHSQDNISNDSPNEGFEIHLNEINVSAQMKEFFLSK
jgi:hypothetical protein